MTCFSPLFTNGRSKLVVRGITKRLKSIFGHVQSLWTCLCLVVGFKYMSGQGSRMRACLSQCPLYNWSYRVLARCSFTISPSNKLGVVDYDDYLQVIWANMLPDLILSVWRGSCLVITMETDTTLTLTYWAHRNLWRKTIISKFQSSVC